MAVRSTQANWFSRPGDSVVSAMHRRALEPDQIAAQLPGGMEKLRGIIAGLEPIEEEVAAALAALLGGTQEFWLNRQANYEKALTQAVTSLSREDANDLIGSVQVPGNRPRGKLTDEKRDAELRKRLAFFGVATIGAWERRYGGVKEKTRFRTSPSLASEEGAVSLWLRQGELAASLVKTGPWNPSLLRTKLTEIVRLSKVKRPKLFLPKLKSLLSEAGVALVVIRPPSGCKASGASRMIRPDKGMILMSFRHRSDDHFWFTILHEAAHLLLHGSHSFVDEDEMPEDECEKEANAFATSIIIPPFRQREFDTLSIDYESVTRFAVSLGVSAGLVVGQLQHRGVVERDRLNFLRRRWTWGEIDEAIASL